MKQHLINYHKTLLEALKQIGSIGFGPLVLFVMDDNNKMVGTLTDGDARRAFIAGADVHTIISEIMRRNFNYIRQGIGEIVSEIRKQKELKMKLIPILDESNHIVDIINLEEFKTKLPIDVVLMAGGKGERLKPLTDKTPKPLLEVGDKAIIDHNVDRLISYGVKHISVTVNYLREQIEEHYKESHNGIQVKCCREPKFLGTMGSIKYVEHFYNDTILVMNSDLFTNIDYEDFYLHFKEHNADMSVAAVPYSVSIPYGILDLNGPRTIKGLLEKPTYDYYANAGIYLIKKSILDLIPSDEFFNATDLIELLISQHKNVIRYLLNGTWIDIGNLQEYKRANDLVKHLK